MVLLHILLIELILVLIKYRIGKVNIDTNKHRIDKVNIGTITHLIDKFNISTNYIDLQLHIFSDLIYH